MPTDPDQPGGSDHPTRAHDPIDPTRAQDPVDPTRVQPGVDPTRAGGAAHTRPDTPRAPLADDVRRGEHDDDRAQKGAWWPWALLAAVLIAIVVYALVQEGDDSDDAVGTTDQTAVAPVESAPEDTTADTTAEPAPEDTTATTDTADTTATTAAADDTDAPAVAPGDEGTVTTADGADLLTLVEGDAGDAERLAPYAGETVTGSAVEVLEVVDGAGFWIGVDEQRRIFAHGPDADAADVEVGDRIDFSGVLAPNAGDGADDVHDIPDDQGAQLHEDQGHHLELGSISPV